MSHFGVLSFLFLKNHPIVIHRKNNNIQVWNYMRVNNHWIFYFFGGKLFLYTWHLKGTHTLSAPYSWVIAGSVFDSCHPSLQVHHKAPEEERERERDIDRDMAKIRMQRECACAAGGMKIEEEEVEREERSQASLSLRAVIFPPSCFLHPSILCQ